MIKAEVTVVRKISLKQEGTLRTTRFKREANFLPSPGHYSSTTLYYSIKSNSNKSEKVQDKVQVVNKCLNMIMITAAAPHKPSASK